MTFPIFFLTHDEPNADENWERLVAAMPDAERVASTGTIRESHAHCASLARESHFFVVDGDNEVVDGFDFATPFDIDPQTVYVWRAQNPINGLVYGHGAIKLFPRAAFVDHDQPVIDMSTSVSTHYRVVRTLASLHRYDTSPFHVWRTAFRECLKLASGAIARQNDRETAERLDTWCTQASGRFAEHNIRGANMGRLYGATFAGNPVELARVNDFEWLGRRFRHEPA